MITLKQFQTQSSKNNLLIGIYDRVYDVTEFQKTHPGGSRVFNAVAGTDATQAFVNFHPKSVFKLLKKYDKGKISDYTVSKDPFVKELIELRRELVNRGLFQTNYWFYVVEALWLFSLLFSSLYFTLATNWLKLGAVLMGLFWQQVAFYGHDTNHSAVTHNRRADFLVGILVGNTTGGIGCGWWRSTHFVHHTIPNSVNHDPDNMHLPVFAVDRIMKEGFFSEFHGRDMKFTQLAAFLVSWQNWTYYPVMMFARINLYVQTILFLASKEKTDYRQLEIITITIFWTGMGMILNSLDTYWDCLTWMVVSTAISGVLEVQVTLSHYPMVSYSGKPETDWFRNQIRTTLDIACPWWMDWFHGSLNHQTIHHIFPRLPRHNLRYATERLKRVCKKHKVQYNSLSFYDANIKLLKHLKSVAEASKTV